MGRDKENENPNKTRNKPVKRKKKMGRLRALSALVPGTSRKESMADLSMRQKALSAKSPRHTSPKNIGQANGSILDFIRDTSQDSDMRNIAQILSGYSSTFFSNNKPEHIDYQDLMELSAYLAAHYHDKPEVAINHMIEIIGYCDSADKTTLLENATLIIEEYLIANAHNPKMNDILVALEELRGLAQEHSAALEKSFSEAIEYAKRENDAFLRNLQDMPSTTSLIAKGTQDPDDWWAQLDAALKNKKKRSQFIMDLASDLLVINTTDVLQLRTDEMYKKNILGTKDAYPSAKRASALANNISHMLAEEIIYARSRSHQKKIYSLLINLAYQCKENGDFESMVAINATFEISSVHRMFKELESMLSQSDLEQLKEIQRIASSANNYSEMRKEEKKQENAVVPFVGKLHTDLTFCNDGNPKEQKGHQYSNRQKLIGRQLQSLQRMQSALALLPAQPQLKTNIASRLNQQRLSENQQYKRSKEVVTRDETEKPFKGIDKYSGRDIVRAHIQAHPPQKLQTKETSTPDVSVETVQKTTKSPGREAIKKVQTVPAVMLIADPPQRKLELEQSTSLGGAVLVADSPVLKTQKTFDSPGVIIPPPLDEKEAQKIADENPLHESNLEIVSKSAGKKPPPPSLEDDSQSDTQEQDKRMVIAKARSKPVQRRPAVVSTYRAEQTGEMPKETQSKARSVLTTSKVSQTKVTSHINKINNTFFSNVKKRNRIKVANKQWTVLREPTEPAKDLEAIRISVGEGEQLSQVDIDLKSGFSIKLPKVTQGANDILVAAAQDYQKAVADNPPPDIPAPQTSFTLKATSIEDAKSILESLKGQNITISKVLINDVANEALLDSYKESFMQPMITRK